VQNTWIISAHYSALVSREKWTIFEDARPSAIRPTPTNKLSSEETALILKTCSDAEFGSYSLGHIVSTLADSGCYIGSESTFCRTLKNAGQLADRSLTKSQHQRKKPNVQVAIKPNEVWTWDISYLATQTRGQHYYLYMIVDIFSRKIVGADVYEQELGELAADFLQRTIWCEKLTYRRQSRRLIK
jgi:putative transposase